MQRQTLVYLMLLLDHSFGEIGQAMSGLHSVVIWTQSPGSTAQSPGSTAQSPGSMAQSPGSMAQSLGSMAQSPGATARKHGAIAGNGWPMLAFLYMNCVKMSKLCQGANAFACFRAIQLRAVPRRAIHGGHGLLLAIASCNLMLWDYGQIVVRTCIEDQDAGKEIRAHFAMCIQ